MLPAFVLSDKLLIGAVLAVVALVALVILLPRVLVREVTAGDAPLPPWMGTVRARRARLRVILGVLGSLAIAVVVWGVVSYKAEKTALVVVDNDSDEPLTLRDGEIDAVVIAPHSHATRKYAPGRNRITIVGEKTVFDREVDLVDRGKYIANPGATNHYAMWTQEYTTSFRFPSQAKTDFTELQRQARGITLIEPANWHEVKGDYVLDLPPALIKSSSRSGSESRRIVSHLSRDSFDVLREAQSKNPGELVDEKFLDRLNTALWSVTVSIPGSMEENGKVK